MIDTAKTILLIAVAAIVTLALRAFPFLIFSGKRQMPPTVKKVVDSLPPAIMGVLVIYCLKDALVGGGMNLISTLIAGISVVLIHLWRKNTLLSIAAGTIIYMILIRFFECVLL